MKDTQKLITIPEPKKTPSDRANASIIRNKKEKIFVGKKRGGIIKSFSRDQIYDYL